MVLGQERDVWSASWTQSWNRYVLDRTFSQLKNAWIVKLYITVPLIGELVSVPFCSESADWPSSPKFGSSLFFMTASWHVHIDPSLYPFSTPFRSYCRWYSVKQYSCLILKYDRFRMCRHPKNYYWIPTLNIVNLPRIANHSFLFCDGCIIFILRLVV